MFISQYFQARDVVNRIKQKFGKNVFVDLLLKDNDGSHKIYKDNIDKIDNHIPEKYTEDYIRVYIETKVRKKVRKRRVMIFWKRQNLK